MDERIDVHALAVAGGIGAVGAAVVVVNDASTSSATLGGTVLSAGPITVSGPANNDSTLTWTRWSAAALPSAPMVDFDVGGNTTAGVANGAQIGQSDTVSSLAVTADSTVDVDSLVVGVTGGAIGVSVNFDFVDVHAVVAASIGDNAMVTTTVRSTSMPIRTTTRWGG